MGYLHGFTVTVLTVIVICYICEALAPEGSFGKYTAVVTGLVVALAIVNAFLQIRSVELEGLPLPQVQTETASPQGRSTDAVSTQFAADLATAVRQRVEEHFGETVHAQAQVSCTNNVLTVESLTLSNTTISETELTAFIVEIFGLVPSYA